MGPLRQVAPAPPELNPHLTKSRLNAAPSLCEMLSPERDQRHFEGGLSDTVLDARRMSTSIAAQSNAARKPKNPYRKSSRKMTTHSGLGAALIGCVVLGAGWTVYTNIL